SETIKALVKAGAPAVSALIAHLDDQRETKIKVEHPGGFGGMMALDEYDFNVRTAKDKPLGVNKGMDEIFKSREEQPETHTLTVGDLCFVALGQIVNRRFSTMRYQPTAIIVINSPTYSKSLREAAIKEWGAL